MPDGAAPVQDQSHRSGSSSGSSISGQLTRQAAPHAPNPTAASTAALEANHAEFHLQHEKRVRPVHEPRNGEDEP